MPDFKIDETIEPGKTTIVHLRFDRAGTFEFHCSIFCGSGHEEMSGQFVVKE
jgi:cytochrome c oxidase subunit 2